MHTRSGRGIRPDQMILMTNSGKASALGVAMKMVEKYKELHPGKPLPVLVQRSGYKDRSLLEKLYERTHGEIESKKETDFDDFDFFFITKMFLYYMIKLTLNMWINILFYKYKYDI